MRGEGEDHREGYVGINPGGCRVRRGTEEAGLMTIKVIWATFVRRPIFSDGCIKILQSCEVLAKSFSMDLSNASIFKGHWFHTDW
jgi:hypothetical protein